MEAGMDMRKQTTSSTSLNKQIWEQIWEHERKKGGDGDDDTRSYAAAKLNPDEKAPFKVLGIPQDVSTDELCFTLDTLKVYPTGRLTKRTLLSATAKSCDPTGHMAPIIITLKILFQSVCQRGNIWDEHLPAKQQEIWDRFLEKQNNSSV